MPTFVGPWRALLGGGVASTLLDALAVYYKLDEVGSVRADSMGVNPLADNGTTLAAAGKINSAGSFVSASSQFLSHADAAALRGGNQSFTIWAWVNPTTLANNRGIVTKASTASEYVLYNVSSAPRFLHYDSGGAIIGTISGTETFVTGEWFLVLGGFNKALGRVFVRLMGVNYGVVYETDVTGTPATRTTADFRIGSFLTNYWDGLIDEVGKVDRLLTEVEMRQLWNNRNGLAYPFTNVPAINLPTYFATNTGTGAALDHFQAALDANYAKVLCIGDSWMEISFIPAQLRLQMQTEYGDGGIGYVNFYSTSNGHETRISAYSRTGTWTETYPTGHSIDLSEITIASAASVDFTATFDRIVVHYRQKVGGGSFQFRIDGGTFQVVNTSGAEAYGTSVISGLANTSHTVEIDYVSGSITLFGAELTSGSTGVVLYKCGHTGGTTAQWAGGMGAGWTAAVTAFDPDLVIVILDINDQSNSVLMATTKTNLLALFDGIPSTTDMLFCAPADSARDVTAGLPYSMFAYAESMFGIAALRDASFFYGTGNFAKYGYASKKSPSYWSSTLHLSATGSVIYADLINTAFLAGR